MKDKAGATRRKYNSTTRQFAKWLYRIIDRYDWGVFSQRKKTPVRTNELWLLESFRQRIPGCYPQKLTMTGIDSQLSGRDKLYYTSARSSGFALICLDVDAHEGQTDAFDAARWIQSAYFPNAYLEASGRGYHLYLLVRVGWCRRTRYNQLLAALEADLTVVLRDQGFESKLEVLGGFSELDGSRFISSARLAPMPHLPHGESDLKHLLAMPVYLPYAFKAISEDANTTREVIDELHGLLSSEREEQSIPDGCVSAPQTRESSCAWQRMQWTCFDFTIRHKQLPSEDQLLEYYRQVYDTHEATAARRNRARYAVRYRSKTFDPMKATDGGYRALEDKLLAAVREHCKDRSSNYLYGITDDDLAIALYAVQVGSFTIAARPKEQWTVGRQSIIAMFRALKRDGVTKQGCNVNKAVALKLILTRAGLIECFDSRYVPGGGNGISKKFTIGPNHWLYGQWVKWAENVQVKKVEQIVIDRATRQHDLIWESTGVDLLLA